MPVTAFQRDVFWYIAAEHWLQNLSKEPCSSISSWQCHCITCMHSAALCWGSHRIKKADMNISAYFTSSAWAARDGWSSSQPLPIRLLQEEKVRHACYDNWYSALSCASNNWFMSSTLINGQIKIKRATYIRQGTVKKAWLPQQVTWNVMDIH
jgi:hypothetical protein